MRSGTTGAWTTEAEELSDTGSPVIFLDVDASKYLTNNPAKIFQVRIGDSTPAGGYGGFLVSVSILNHLDTADWQSVLSSQSLFGWDVHSSLNKGYYTLDLSSVLSNNPTKEVFVKLTDGSTGDGWFGGGGRPNYGDAAGGWDPVLSPGQVILTELWCLPGDMHARPTMKRAAA